jgi:hypothetical protein
MSHAHLLHRVVCTASVLALALALVCAASASTASAQAGASSPSEYELSLSRALEAHARGDYERAREYMERAHQLEPSARTERGLGIVAFAQGKYLAAIRHFDAALASAVKPLPDDLRSATADLLAHAWAQVARCELRVEPSAAEVSIDDAPPDYYAEHVVVLTPGTHVLSVRAGDHAPATLQVETKPGEQRVLQVVLAPLAAPGVVEKIVYRDRGPRALDKPEPSPGFYTPEVRRVAGALGGGLVVAGGVVWGVGYKRFKEVRDLCQTKEDGCTKSQAQAGFDRRHIGTYATAGLVTAGVGLAFLVTMGGLEIWQLRQRALAVEASASGLAVHGQF